MKIKNINGVLFAVALMATASVAWADEPAVVEGESALKLGTYFSPMGEFAMNAGKSQVKNPLGGLFTVGYREDFWAVEAGFSYASTDPKVEGGTKVKQTGGALNVLIFPTTRIPGLYGLIGGGALAVKNYPDNGTASFSVTNFQGGLGYLQKIRLGNYQFALRGEAAYRYGFRENGQATNEFRTDTDAPRQFHDVMFRVGLVLPIDLTHWLGLDHDAPVKVVPVETTPQVVAPAPAEAPPAPVAVPQDGSAAPAAPAPAPATDSKPDDLDFLKDAPTQAAPPPAKDGH